LHGDHLKYGISFLVDFQETGMFLKKLSFAVFGALLVTAGTLAAGYRPDDFLTLDLSKAVLSPTPLGPRNQFVPMPVEARGDASGDGRTGSTHASQPRVMWERVARRHERPPQTRRGAARARLAHRHGNPLDAHAQAIGRLIQTWPCRSGGICNWKRVPMAEQ
jgi:hypothetical protein